MWKADISRMGWQSATVWKCTWDAAKLHLKGEIMVKIFILKWLRLKMNSLKAQIRKLGKEG